MIQQYLTNINKRYKTGFSGEHSYRGDLQDLLKQLCPGVMITNEPARIECGAPDYILTKGKIPVGYIEAKDIGEDLTSKKHKEQFDRYRASLDNLIITDYLDFRLYREGEFITSVRIGERDEGKIKPITENFEKFRLFIEEFCSYSGITIKSSRKLAGMMAGKARLLANIIDNALQQDEAPKQTDVVQEIENNTLKAQFHDFQRILIHDITPKEFADIYAQTIAYGMFAARLHDPTLEDFSRQEAAELIPKSNPFLRKLFQYIAGYDLDDRIKWVVDALADIFRATNVAALLENFGKATQQTDPMIHFYETFLSIYDPKQRKTRGVWYTPEPVVNFIVRAVDDILKEEFGLKDGLADTSKTKVKVKSQNPDYRYKGKYKTLEQDVHKVQILDPAAGTGTFLSEVVKNIYQRFEGQQGMWSDYVEQHLLPRINGFELIMASYAMAHLKLELLLNETGYKPTRNQRLRVYLTNSLEEHHPDTGTLFAQWLANEANEANRIKRDTPVMVVLGNPPYSVSSRNKGEWIQNLMKDYKNGLNDRNIQPLSDDYLKFIRYGQHYIEKNGEGVLAYISNNSFLDGIIHRQMRKNLLETFDKIYIIDLHGNSKKKEKGPDGRADQNVFDIQQGVSVNLFVKTSSKKQLAKVYLEDLAGNRDDKYNALLSNSLKSLTFKKIRPKEPEFFFIKSSLEGKDAFKRGFKITEIFIRYSNGFTTEKDSITIKFDKEDIEKVVTDMAELKIENFQKKYSIETEGRDWKSHSAQNDILANKGAFIKVLYRPFDFRFSYYTGKSKGFFAFPRNEVLGNLKYNNIALILPKQNDVNTGGYITNIIAGHKTFSAYNKNSIFPLYLYNEKSNQQTIEIPTSRTPNLNPKIVNEIAQKLSLTFTPEKEATEGTLAPIDILDYIYAVLHSPTYREKYKEFLKIDFPRVPYPADVEKFWQLVALGGELRRIHLLESDKVEQFITTYPEDGDNTITRKMTKTSPGFELTDPDNHLGKVWINDSQYFGQVPQLAWEFYIGGYQPAQKWLKDRKDRQLSFDDIRHYQKIIVALTETDRLMKEIDKLKID
ncbi:MAG: N-6 DNA methylase [Bacteroidales bacterium]|nr:N-6 DNA methylase [Bacteroidales bacterium]MCF8333495.1 N-6 DNA methylase [Bacteroidales bacterium]